MISLIVAMSENSVIGVDGKLPWHLPEDLKRFKRLTTAHPIVMGRKTFDSIGKPLPGRANIVITRNTDWKADGVLTTHSLQEALNLAKQKPGSEEIFILGGGEIFTAALPQADRIYLTLVHENVRGNAYFPKFEKSDYSISLEERHEGSPSYTYLNLERRS